MFQSPASNRFRDALQKWKDYVESLCVGGCVLSEMALDWQTTQTSPVVVIDRGGVRQIWTLSPGQTGAHKNTPPY